MTPEELKHQMRIITMQTVLGLALTFVGLVMMMLSLAAMVKH